MPDNTNELVWWLFNALWLVLVGVIGWIVNGIKNEIKELRKEIALERSWGRWLVNVIMSMRTRCAMLHPASPLNDLPPSPPESIE